jgi:hypothetical protein
VLVFVAFSLISIFMCACLVFFTFPCCLFLCWIQLRIVLPKTVWNFRSDFKNDFMACNIPWMFSILASCYIRLTLNICSFVHQFNTKLMLALHCNSFRLQFTYLYMLLVSLLLNILYFSILLHSFNTEYLFFCPSM